MYLESEDYKIIISSIISLLYNREMKTYDSIVTGTETELIANAKNAFRSEFDNLTKAQENQVTEFFGNLDYGEAPALVDALNEYKENEQNNIFDADYDEKEELIAGLPHVERHSWIKEAFDDFARNTFLASYDEDSAANIIRQLWNTRNTKYYKNNDRDFNNAAIGSRFMNLEDFAYAMLYCVEVVAEAKISDVAGTQDSLNQIKRTKEERSRIEDAVLQTVDEFRNDPMYIEAIVTSEDILRRQQQRNQELIEALLI